MGCSMVTLNSKMRSLRSRLHVERLEHRRVLSVFGDANGDEFFDTSDLVQVLQANKYLTGETATFEEGDWNGDGVFDELDLLGALESGCYLNRDCPANHAPMSNDDSYVVDEDDVLITATEAGVLSNDADDDGDALSALLVSPPSNGTLTLDADGSFVYTPNRNFHGTDSFTYAATDNNAQAPGAVVIVTVNPINDAPMSSDDSYIVDEDDVLITATEAGVLSNDADDDGDALVAILVSHPANGTLTLNENGSFEYRPNDNFHGLDSFIYSAMDARFHSRNTTAKIMVIPVNDPPTQINDTYVMNEDTLFTVDAQHGVLSNDFDVDSDLLTAELMESSVGLDEHLRFTADGSFEIEPPRNFHGVISFTYRATDGQSRSAEATVTIQVNPIDYLVVQAENMSFAGPGLSNNGGFVTFSQNAGIASTISVSEGGLYELVVRALGQEAGAELPRMQTFVDGVLVGGTVNVTGGEYRDYSTGTIGLAAGDHTLSVHFVNDHYVPGLEDRNLFVDSVTIDQLDQVEPLVLEAENMSFAGPGLSNNGGFVTFSQNAGISTVFGVGEAKFYRIEVVALGQEAGAELPKMQVFVDGFPVGGAVEVPDGGYRDYDLGTIGITPGAHAISVHFVNDHYIPGVEDRNLFVDRILITNTGRPFTIPRDGFEPNESYGAARHLGRFSNTRVTDLTIHDNADVDWFSFTSGLQKSRSHFVDLRVNLVFDGATSRLKFDLFRGAQSKQSESVNENAEIVTVGNINTDERIYIKVFGAQNPTYFINVSFSHRPR